MKFQNSEFELEIEEKIDDFKKEKIDLCSKVLNKCSINSYDL